MTKLTRLRLIMGAVAIVILVVIATVVALMGRPAATIDQDDPCDVLGELAFSLQSTVGSGAVDVPRLTDLASTLGATSGYENDPFGSRVLDAVALVTTAQPDDSVSAADAALDAVAVAQAQEGCPASRK